MKKNKSLPRIRFGIALKLDRHSTANLSFLEANEVLNSGFSVFRYDKKMKYPAAELTGHRVTRTPNLIASMQLFIIRFCLTLILNVFQDDLIRVLTNRIYVISRSPKISTP